MVRVDRRAFRVWIGNKIVFPLRGGNRLKERFTNPLGFLEEKRAKRPPALRLVGSNGDYSHSIVLGGFEEMS